ncbi:MAG TPA: FAD:protein FMN transferase [Blastocatellia bacterium]|nr:FAD:protein FMN transferase [Blastocatellia bacterium]
MLNRRQFFSLPRNAPPSRSDYWLHLHRSAMACRFEITLSAEDRAGVPAAHDALNLIDRLEDQLTVFRESSEISYINRNASARAVEVEAELFRLLLQCEGLYRATEGAFDITTGPLTRCWGFLRREGRIPQPDELEAARLRVGMHNVRLDRDRRTVRFSRPGVEINLGSIGKGYALDRVGYLMRRRGVRTALASGGSSGVLAIGGGDGGEGWPVGIRHPLRRDTRFATLRLRDSAMATSGSAEQYFESGGKRYGHIIDPRSGVPASGVLGVTVAASSAAVADALATAFYVAGREAAERYCADHPEVLVVMIEDGAPDHPLVIGSNSLCEMEAGYE